MSTSSVSSSVLDELLPFFGGDKKGPTFVQALYRGTDYGNVVFGSQFQSWDNVEDTIVHQLMRSMNYNNYTKNVANNGRAQDAEDIHQDIADLVIRAALFHRTIDETKAFGSSVGSVRNQIKESIDNYLSKNGETLVKNIAMVGNNVVEAAKGAKKNADNWPDIRLTDPTVSSTVKDELAKLIDCGIKGTFCREVLGDKNDFVNNNKNVEIALSNGFVKLVKTALDAMWANTKGNRSTISTHVSENANTYVQILKSNIDAVVMSDVRDLLSGMNIEHTTLSNETAKALFEKIHKRWPELSGEARQFYKSQLMLLSKKGVSKFVTRMTSDASIAEQSMNDWIVLTPAELDNIMNMTLSAADYDNLRLNIMKSVRGGERSAFEMALPVVPKGKKLWYTSKNGIRYTTDYSEHILSDLYRLVYNGALAGSDNVQIGGAARFENLSNNYASLSTAEFNLNYSVYVCEIMKGQERIAEKRTKPEESKDAGSINDYTWLSATDYAYGGIWRWDQQKGVYMKNVNGNWVEYGCEKDTDKNNCYGTYLARGNDQQCRRLIDCLFSGDVTTLHLCLDAIKDADLWTVAEDDVKSVHPDKVRAILHKFGVRAYRETDANGKTYKVPYTYEEWMTKVVNGAMPEDVKKSIKNTPNLLTYIKGLLHVCRKNPSILNKGEPSIVERESTPTYFRDLNLPKYKIPHATKNKRDCFKFLAASLRNQQYPQLQVNDMFNNIISGTMSNVHFSNPYTTVQPTMWGTSQLGGGVSKIAQSGGNIAVLQPGLSSRISDTSRIEKSLTEKSSSSAFEQIYAGLMSGLKDIGVRIHGDDVYRIQNAMLQMTQLEEKLSKLFCILQVFVDVARVHGIPLAGIDRENPRVINLKQIGSRDDLNCFIIKYIKDIKRNMINNLDVQSAIGVELMQHVYPTYADECSGEKESTDRQTEDLISV